LTEQRAAQLIAPTTLSMIFRRSMAVKVKSSNYVSSRAEPEETAEVVKISPSTVQREWRAAKAWLHHAMSKTDES